MSLRILFLGKAAVLGTLSAFFDECNQENKFQPGTKYYTLPAVLHDQGDPIDTLIAAYEANLRKSSLPNVPFHAYDLQHKRGGYTSLELETRKKPHPPLYHDFRRYHTIIAESHLSFFVNSPRNHSY